MWILSRVGGLCVIYKTGFGLKDWFHYTLYIPLGTSGNHSAIAELHILHINITYAIRFSVFTSRILATVFITISLALQITHKVFLSHTNPFLVIIVQLLILKFRLNAIPLFRRSYPSRLSSRDSTRLHSIPLLSSSYPSKLVSRNSTPLLSS